jgi:hypothetical protein
MWWFIVGGILAVIAPLVFLILDRLQVVDCAIVKVNRVNNKVPMYCIGVYKGKKLIGFLKAAAINSLISLNQYGYLSRNTSGSYDYVADKYYSASTLRTENLDEITKMYNEIRLIMNLEDNFIRLTPLQNEKSFLAEETFNKSRQLTMELLEASRNGDEELELTTLKELQKLHNE